MSKSYKFSFCSKFSGKDASATRWLKSFKHELEDFEEDGKVPPHIFIKYFDLLLSEDAADWAEANPEVSRLIETENPTTETVD